MRLPIAGRARIFKILPGKGAAVRRDSPGWGAYRGRIAGVMRHAAALADSDAGRRGIGACMAVEPPYIM